MIDIDTRREIEALRDRRDRLTDTFVRECDEINTKIKMLKRMGSNKEQNK